MLPRAPRLARALVPLCALLGCETASKGRAAADSSSAIVGLPVVPRAASSSVASAAPAPVTVILPPANARDSAARVAVEGWFARHAYSTWGPAARDRAMEPVCARENDDGSDTVDFWGIATARVLGLEPIDTTWKDRTRLAARVAVTRVVSVQGDPASSDGDNFASQMRVVRPDIDTLLVEVRQRSDSSWAVCGADPLITVGAIPVILVGPADTLFPETTLIKRSEPAGATWALARALADSVARATRRP